MPITRFEDFSEPNEVTYAEGRLTTRTYVSKSFAMAYGQDAGHPARYIYRVFDEAECEDDEDWEWTNEVVYTTPGGRKQLQLQIARSQGAVRQIRIQKVPTNGDDTKLEKILELNRSQSRALIELIRAIEDIPIDGESSIYVDHDLLRDAFADPTAAASIYASDPGRFRALIESDADAEDVVALKRRREVAATMRRWLEDDNVFDVAANEAGGPERAWQRLLEANPWVLGVGLGGHLLTSWHHERLEQTVVGASYQGPGKRVDALMRTAGIVRSLVFAEIKHHRTALLKDEYRSGCWSPSHEVAGAVVQAQQTVHRACQDVDDYLHDQSDEGELLPTGTFVLQPRSFLIVGSLAELVGSSGGPLRDKVRSFELFRRNLNQPEVLTFDELVLRAEWHVESAERQSSEEGEAEEGEAEDPGEGAASPDPWGSEPWGAKSPDVGSDPWSAPTPREEPDWADDPWAT